MAAKPPGAPRGPRKPRAPGAIPKATSPLATGDYGGRYQDRVDGWLLALLLMRQPLLNVPGTVVGAAFQRRIHGALLDDSVVTTDSGVEVQLSIKVGAAVTEHDADFRDALMLAWKAQADGRWAAIVAPPDATGLKTLRQLVFLAHENDTVAEFLVRTTTPGVIGDRDRIDACRNILDAAAGAPISDAQFHAFLRKFVVVGLDFDIPPHHDQDTVVAALESVRGITRDQSSTLFSKLIEIGEDLAIAAASVDYAGLENRLRLRKVVAGLPPDLRPLRAALTSYADRTFESRAETVAGVHLDRAHLAADVETALADGHDVVVTGAAGFGKSTLVRTVAEKLSAEGPVLHLSGRRVEMAGSWPNLAAEIGLPPHREQLAQLLATHPRGATVVIDSVEHIVSASARALTNDLLRDLSTREVPLNVVLGVRDSALPNIGWLDVAVLRPVRQVTVGGLTQSETTQIAQASPVLGELVARSRKPFPGGLKLLALLHDDRISDAELAKTHATESDLLDLWWRTVLVGDTDAAHDRFRIVLAAAEAGVAQPSGFFELPLTASSTAIASLVRDGVLVLEPKLDRYRFGHDIIQDWAIVHWLANGAGDPAKRLKRALATPGYYRAVSLYAQQLAERNPPQYTAMRTVVATLDDQRGVHAFLCALVLSPHARTLLEAHKAELLANDATELGALVRMIEAEQITLDVEIFDSLRRTGATVSEATALAASESPPRWRVWSPLLRFCLENIEAIGSAFYPFLKFAERWQRTTPPKAPHRRGVLDAAIRVVTFCEDWRPHTAGERGPKIPRANRDAAETAARAIIAFSTDVDPEFVASYLHDLVTLGYGGDQDDMLAFLPAVSRTFTDEVIAFGSSVLIAPDVPPWELDTAYVGIRDHLYFPASDAQGPFLGILRMNEGAGLGLVRALARRAIEKYTTRVEEEGAHFRPLTFTFAKTTRTFVGDGRAYTWYRPGAHDSSVLTSALMAVDTWAFEAIATGRPALEIVELLLGDDAPLPFLGIVVGLAYDYPELVPPLADLFAQPWFWRLEDDRLHVDLRPADINALLPLEHHLPAYKPHLAERNLARDAKRERFRFPLTFAVDLLFRPTSAAVRDTFVQRVSEMTIADAAFYGEEAALIEDDPSSQDATFARDVFADFAQKTKAESYERRDDGGVRLRPQIEDSAATSQRQTAQAIEAIRVANLTANTILRDYRPPETPLDFDTLGQSAEKLIVDGRITGSEVTEARASILRCACVAATFAPYVGATAPPWSVQAVLAAARMYDEDAWHADVDDSNAMDMRVCVATALGALFAAQPDDDELRRLAFRLATHVLPEVARGLLRGVLPLWERRPAAAATILSLLLDAAVRTKGSSASDAQLAAADSAERRGTARAWPVFKNVAKPGIYRIGKVLGSGLPRRITDRRAIAALVPLIEALLHLSESGGDDGLWLGFDGAVARLAANVDAGIVDGYSAFRARLADWQGSPVVYAETVAGLVRSHLADAEVATAAARFEALADPFLRADHRATFAREHLDRDFRNTCWALLFVQEYEPLLVPKDWAHAARFADHIGRWVAAVGGHPTNASALLVFLEQFAAAFSAARIVGWLETTIGTTAAAHLPTLWRDHGWAIGVLLLDLVTERAEDMREPETHRRAVAIAEQLLGAGVHGAGELRDGLDQIHRR